MDRRFQWIVRNGAFAVALYFAIVWRVEWLHYAVAALAWWRLGVNVWAVPGPRTARSITSIDVPQMAMMTFDLAVLGAMFLAHWYWTVFAYALSCACFAVARARAASKP